MSEFVNLKAEMLRIRAARIEELEAENERLRAENERLRALLEEDASDLTDWGIFWKISDALGWERPHG